MSKINYSFTPIPNYFFDNGWFENPKMAKFILWAFRRCSSVRQEKYFDHKLVVLEPFEFIFGRRICSEETGLTEQEIRTIINQLKTTQIGEILKKSTSKSTSKFSVYKWSTELFSENINQQINQQVTSNQPASNHNKRTENSRPGETTTPLPPSFSKRIELTKSSNSVVVVSPYGCLEKENMNLQDKIALSKFPEENVKNAIRFADSLNGNYKKNRVSTLFWAVKACPSLQSNLDEKQRLALEFNEWARKLLGEKIYNENLENIKNHFLRYGIKNCTITLKSDIKTVKIDLQEIKNQLFNSNDKEKYYGLS
jgi:hypothetical protein